MDALIQLLMTNYHMSEQEATAYASDIHERASISRSGSVPPLRADERSDLGQEDALQREAYTPVANKAVAHMDNLRAKLENFTALHKRIEAGDRLAPAEQKFYNGVRKAYEDKVSEAGKQAGRDARQVDIGDARVRSLGPQVDIGRAQVRPLSSAQPAPELSGMPDSYFNRPGQPRDEARWAPAPAGSANYGSPVPPGGWAGVEHNYPSGARDATPPGWAGVEHSYPVGSTARDIPPTPFTVGPSYPGGYSSRPDDRSQQSLMESLMNYLGGSRQNGAR